MLWHSSSTIDLLLLARFAWHKLISLILNRELLPTEFTLFNWFKNSIFGVPFVFVLHLTRNGSLTKLIRLCNLNCGLHLSFLPVILNASELWCAVYSILKLSRKGRVKRRAVSVWLFLAFVALPGYNPHILVVEFAKRHSDAHFSLSHDFGSLFLRWR